MRVIADLPAADEEALDLGGGKRQVLAPLSPEVASVHRVDVGQAPGYLEYDHGVAGIFIDHPLGQGHHQARLAQQHCLHGALQRRVGIGHAHHRAHIPDDDDGAALGVGQAYQGFGQA